MKTRTEIKEELLDQYPINEQVLFNDFNIEEKLQGQLKLEMQYNDLYIDAQYVFDKIDDILIDKKCELYDYYKFEYERTLSKSEIEDYYIPKHKDIKIINERLELQMVKVNFFKICFSAVKQLRWNIHSYLKNRES